MQRVCAAAADRNAASPGQARREVPLLYLPPHSCHKDTHSFSFFQKREMEGLLISLLCFLPNLSPQSGTDQSAPCSLLSRSLRAPPSPSCGPDCFLFPALSDCLPGNRDYLVIHPSLGPVSGAGSGLQLSLDALWLNCRNLAVENSPPELSISDVPGKVPDTERARGVHHL